jgi:IPTL-CTERM motif
VTAPAVGLADPAAGGDAIPTLSEWALILLAMMLAAIGMRSQREARNNMAHENSR